MKKRKNFSEINENLIIKKLYMNYKWQFYSLLCFPIVILLIIYISYNVIRGEKFNGDMWATLVSGCIAYYGAVLLGMLAFWQNERMNISNNNAQQKLEEANKKIIEINEKLYNLNEEIRKENNENIINTYATQIRKENYNLYRDNFQKSIEHVIKSLDCSNYGFFFQRGISIAIAIQLNDKWLFEDFSSFNVANTKLLMLQDEEKNNEAIAQPIFDDFCKFVDNLCIKKKVLQSKIAEFIIEKVRGLKKSENLVNIELGTLPAEIFKLNEEYKKYFRTLTLKAKKLNDAIVNQLAEDLLKTHPNNKENK